MENKITNQNKIVSLSSCSSNIIKQLHLFISQNNIPITIHTKKKPSNISQTGGGTDQKPIIYQSEYTPYTIFANFMDTIFLQKKQDNIQDTQNKQLLSTIFSKDKTKTQNLQSLEALNKEIYLDNQHKIKEKEKEKKEPSKIQIQIPKTREDNTLYLHINTNNTHPNPIHSIKGTKLYYLYLRQQDGQCTQFV